MWSLQDAKNRFSAVLDAAMAGQPQRVSRRGKPAVVILSAADYDRMRQAAGGGVAPGPIPGPERGPRVLIWLAAQPEDSLFLSVITLAGNERGITRQEGRHHRPCRRFPPHGAAGSSIPLPDPLPVGDQGSQVKDRLMPR